MNKENESMNLFEKNVESYKNHLKRIVQDQKVVNLLLDFLKEKRTDILLLENNETSYKINLKLWAQTFSNIGMNELSWNEMCKQLKRCESGLSEIRAVYGFAYETQRILDRHSDYLKENQWIFTEKLGGSTTKTVFFEGSNPLNLQKCTDGVKVTFLYLHCHNYFIREILREFVDTLKFTEQRHTRIRKFIYRFEQSFMVLPAFPKSFVDFNIDTFKKQYRFFRNLDLSNSKGRYARFLVNFYIFLCQKYEVFSLNDGINKHMLFRPDFHNIYAKGFKVVYANKLDEIPIFHRWVVAPNGEEKGSTVKRYNEYFLVDFLKVKNERFRYLLKHWFWHSELNIYTKSKDIYSLFYFINYIQKKIDFNYSCTTLTKVNSNKSMIFIAENIAAFRLYTLYKYQNNKSINSHIYVVKDFLKHISKYELEKVETQCFELLNQIEKGEAKPNPILKEDLNKIICEYKKKEKTGELKYKLYWIILSLKLTTNLRINEILSIKVKDIKRINDKNVLMVLRKTKGRKKQEYYPNQYVMRLINLAIEITEFLRNENKNDKTINEYVFLNASIKGGIRVITRDVFYRDFRRTIKNLDLSQDNYTVYNLRDTFMSNIFEEGKKQGVNIFDIHKVTGHANMETTIKHYRKSNIQNYLEAMFYIKLDNVIVNGTVVENPREGISDEIYSLKSVIVRNESGYCGAGTCIAEKDLDCLMCPSFITTLDRIPYIIESIKQIEKDIKQSVYDEKVELLHIKKLYVAYLKKLYELKEERSKDA
ncbi:hypothetical protein COM60_08390 [Bacillus toyonensis]|nr:hypothetical protein COM60_08390 [Bacillus toyonensis]